MRKPFVVAVVATGPTGVPAAPAGAAAAPAGPLRSRAGTPSVSAPRLRRRLPPTSANGTYPGAPVFESARRPKYLLQLLNGSHVPFARQAKSIITSVLHFLDRYLKHHPGSINALVEDGDVPGVSGSSRAR